jgi:hypothetical protein
MSERIPDAKQNREATVPQIALWTGESRSHRPAVQTAGLLSLLRARAFVPDHNHVPEVDYGTFGSINHITEA